MRRAGGRAGGSLRLGRSVLLGALVLLGACQGTPTLAPPAAEGGPGDLDLDLLRRASDTYRKYVKALLLCRSTDPADRQLAVQELNALYPFRVFQEDSVLIDAFAGGSEEARLELGRRGVILEALGVFVGPYDAPRWEEARKTLMEAGVGGPELMVSLLFPLLLNGQYSDRWVHLRYALVRGGPVALETAIGLVRRLAKETPSTAVFKLDDLTQIIVLLIDFGEEGRPILEELASYENPNVRRAVARAVGEAQDISRVDFLARTAREDADWAVRTSAVQALGRMRPARAAAGPILLERLGEERDPFVIRAVVDALGDLHCEAAVPALVSLLEGPVGDLGEPTMVALERITGERIRRKDEWLKWYAEKYASWKADRPH